MPGLTWKLNRLRSMGAPELASRSAQAIAQKLEKRRLMAGQVPRPGEPVRPGTSLFPLLEGWQGVLDDHAVLQRATLHEQAKGKISLFGNVPVHFGDPVDWHFDPTSGKSLPLTYGKEIDYRAGSIVGNVKLVWELGRHQHLIPHAVAYARTGETGFRSFVVEQIENWIDANPCGLGIHWCSSLELALRLISWACVHSLIALQDGSEGLFAATTDRRKLGNAIYQQASFIRHYLSRFSSANNHLIGELAGLWTACNVFDLGETGKKWGKFAANELETESRRQVHPDGVNKEQAVYYHLWVMEYFLFADLVGQRSGREFPDGFRAVIERMANFLRTVTPTGGVPPQFGDADDGFVTRFDVDWPDNPYTDVLMAQEAIKDHSNTVPAPSQKAFWYMLGAGRLVHVRRSAAGPSRRSYPSVFPDGGYAVLGEDNLHVVFDAGPLGYLSIAAHGHADALSVCVAVNGTWWLVDPGTFAYHTEPEWRAYFRSSSAHSTITVDGADQSQMGGPFLWTRHAKARLEECATRSGQSACGLHDGYLKHGIIHARHVSYRREAGTLTIEDELNGKGKHDFRIYFHFAPRVELERDKVELAWHANLAGNKARLSLQVDPLWKWETFRGSESPRLGWYSSRFGHIEPSPTLRGRLVSNAPVKLITNIQVQNVMGKPCA